MDATKLLAPFMQPVAAASGQAPVGAGVDIDAVYPRLSADGYVSSGVRIVSHNSPAVLRSAFNDPRVSVLQERANELQAYIDLSDASEVLKNVGLFCEELRLYGAGLDSDSQLTSFKIFLQSIEFLEGQVDVEVLKDCYREGLANLESFMWMMIGRALGDEQYQDCIAVVKTSFDYLNRYYGAGEDLLFRKRLCVLLDADGLHNAVQDFLGQDVDKDFFDYSFSASIVHSVLRGERRILFVSVEQFVSEWRSVFLAMKNCNAFLEKIGQSQFTMDSLKRKFLPEFSKLTPEQKAAIEIGLRDLDL